MFIVFYFLYYCNEIKLQSAQTQIESMKRLTLLGATLLITLCGFSQATLTINPGWT